jgi:hypothetical protein
MLGGAHAFNEIFLSVHIMITVLNMYICNCIRMSIDLIFMLYFHLAVCVSYPVLNTHTRHVDISVTKFKYDHVVFNASLKVQKRVVFII